ncbi:RNA-binding domain-containing protein, partial [Rhizodiscina lignyota]
EDSDDLAEASSPPQHETLTGEASDLEKAARTVFLGNVSSTAITSKSARKKLLAHLSSHLSSLETHTPPHKLESLRFRSTAFASAIPKRAAFAKQELMDATTKSTNAYAVYSTKEGAREAAKHLNGTVILDRYLRVDEVAHPAKVDHRRCVFVGNLGFEPSDVEEGLWREFGKAGIVESVRVVRDAKTRVGKGFAYVQFTDENAVEAALLFNDKKFPPMLPRKLRVVRAKGMKRNQKNSSRQSNYSRAPQSGVYRPKITSEQQSLQGRAGRLLGKAGAAKLGSAPR